MPFKSDLALQNIPLSRQPFKIYLSQYNLPITRTNKCRTLSLQEMELDGRFLILHIVLETCTNTIHAQV